MSGAREKQDLFVDYHTRRHTKDGRDRLSNSYYVDKRLSELNYLIINLSLAFDPWLRLEAI